MDENYLIHYGRSKKDGAPVGSGRYPLGSGQSESHHMPKKQQGHTNEHYNGGVVKKGASRKDKEEYWTKQNVKAGKDKPPTSRAEQAIGKAKSGADAAKDIARVGSKYSKKREHPEISEMSNKELQEVINRMNLEKQYSNLVDGDIKSGWEKASDILEVLGDVVTVVGSAAGIYLLFKNSPIG